MIELYAKDDRRYARNYVARVGTGGVMRALGPDLFEVYNEAQDGIHYSFMLWHDQANGYYTVMPMHSMLRFPQRIKWATLAETSMQELAKICKSRRIKLATMIEVVHAISAIREWKELA